MDTKGWSYNPGWAIATCIAIFAGYWWVRLPGKDTELLLAARHNDTNSIRALVIKGANLNTRFKGKGATALMIAAEQGNQEAVELLLKLGEDKGLKDTFGRTASDYALERGQTNVATSLL